MRVETRLGSAVLLGLGLACGAAPELQEPLATASAAGSGGFLEVPGGKLWFEELGTGPALDRAELEQTLLDLERGLDLLEARPEVDPARLGYVGHSLGATVGGALLGRDARIRASVLMAGLPALTHALAAGHLRGAAGFRALLSDEEQRRYEAALSVLDAVEFVGERAPNALLFQFAWRDEYISRFDAALFVLAAGEPSETRWYETDHFFDREAREERVAWLEAALGSP